MRLEKLETLLKIAGEMSCNPEGLTLDEIATIGNVGRRTAERFRDIINETFGPIEIIEDGKRKRFYLKSSGLGRFHTTPTANELSELENAARQADRRKDKVRAEALRSLLRKIMISLRDADKLRLTTDVDAALKAETFTRYVGPQPFRNPLILQEIKSALLKQKVIKIDYISATKDIQPKKVVPYGLLYGSRYYLVASTAVNEAPKYYRLDRIQNITVTDEAGFPPTSFNLDHYISTSFGVFHENSYAVSLLFDKSVADDALSFQFHPTQTVEPIGDGSISVQFTASGLLEIARHLMTWSDTVTINGPDELKIIMESEIKKMFSHHRC
jgi:predicted DNA-binding transcriptional regulator YafY